MTYHTVDAVILGSHAPRSNAEWQIVAIDDKTAVCVFQCRWPDDDTGTRVSAVTIHTHFP